MAVRLNNDWNKIVAGIYDWFIHTMEIGKVLAMHCGIQYEVCFVYTAHFNFTELYSYMYTIHSVQTTDD